MHDDERTTDESVNATDSLERFSGDLRRQRLAAGNPTYAHLQHITGISRTVLSDALRGSSLPSERTIDALLRALGGDPEPFLGRRAKLARAPQAESITEPSPAGLADGEAIAAVGTPRQVTRRFAAILAAGTFVMGSVISLGTASAVGQLTAAREGAPLVAAKTGTNPLGSPCLEDASPAVYETRTDGAVLEIIWSDRCQAGWGRITRADNASIGNSVTIAIYPQDDPFGDLRQDGTVEDVQSAFTEMLVKPSLEARICAEGSYTVDGQIVSLGDPVCS